MKTEKNAIVLTESAKNKIVLTESTNDKIVLTESFLWFAEIVLCATVALGRQIIIYNADYLQSLLLRGVVEILVLSLKETNFNVLLVFGNVIITIIIVIIE